jgi:AhpD family alkylhydroperoxidase
MLSDKDQELIAVGASIASGCRPCTAYHFRAARIAGANEQEIREAAEDALCVRNRATEIMTRLSGAQSGDAPTPETTGGETKTLVRELVAVGAAFAVNCTANLERHLAAARQQGATDDQLLTALKIAGAIKNTAESKARAAAAKAIGCSEDPNASCGCQGAGGESAKTEQAAAKTAEDIEEPTETCGCQNR